MITNEQVPERDIPAPQYEVLKQTIDTEETQQWLVKCRDNHTIRAIGIVEDGKVLPPQYGETDHVLVTQRTSTVETNDGEKRDFQETTVYASDEGGNFYNAALWVTPGIHEIWEAMFAIGEI